jgi:hypothetical protein
MTGATSVVIVVGRDRGELFEYFRWGLATHRESTWSSTAGSESAGAGGMVTGRPTSGERPTGGELPERRRSSWRGGS